MRLVDFGLCYEAEADEAVKIVGNATPAPAIAPVLSTPRREKSVLDINILPFREMHCAAPQRRNAGTSVQRKYAPEAENFAINPLIGRIIL